MNLDVCYCKFQQFRTIVLVNDCVAECPVMNSCGGEEITCKRTCENAEFGHSECPVNEEEKIVFCPPRACGLFIN